ncbi:MAG: hypothetical protein AAGF24_13050 [Cyanobacteria bacterium P01_H01_bin.121]
MTTLLEIKEAIEQLPEEDIRQLAAWLPNYLDQIWVKQIDAELASVELNGLVAETLQDTVELSQPFN